MDFIKEDIVISGIGGYFPKSRNVGEFADLLFKNEYLLEPKWPEGERGVCNLCGTIPTYQKFDNSYFGIHRQQCTFMDPMHRLLMERTFEALIDAGVNPNEVRGRKIGVYMGSTIGENDNFFLESVVSGFGVTGHSRAMMPNRISYWLNLKGPSVAYDCNWMTGLEVIRLAYNSIKSGQCESVIVGAVNLAIHSQFQWIYNEMGLLSQDGSTKAFDANASGYGRSDGTVVLYLQKASVARRCYATIMHVNTRFDGTHNDKVLSHSVDGMEEFMKDFYEKTSVKPEEVSLVETYGCGLKETDQKELEALERIYCKNRKDPLLITSVKTITGHAEAASSLFSVVNVLVAMEKGTIPATLQFESPNPEINALVKGKMQVVTQNTNWTPKYAAVNALGINSYYGHLLLKANTKPKPNVPMDLPMLVNISTRTEEGIKEILETLKTKPKDPEYYKLIHGAFAEPIQGHLYRGYTLLGEEVKEETLYHTGNKRQIWFVYSGMGSQWNGMLGDLMRFDVCAQSLQKSHDILATKGLDLFEIITTKDKTIFDTILNCFVGIAAIQIALTDLLKALGIVPDGIIGHSVGELGCAYADGCMTAEQMILAAYSRGRASIEVELIKGMMAAVGLGYNQIRYRLPESIEVACHNGPESCTISGPTEDMEKFVKELTDQGTFARLVNVANIAYHSRYIKPAAPLLLKYLKEVIPEPVARSSKWISTSNLQSQWDTDLAKHSSPEYHTNNLLSSVLFEEGCKHIPKDAVLIEIAPHGLLQAILKRSVLNTISIPLTQRGSKSGVEFLLQSLGKMYLSGMDFNVSNIYPKIEYPISRGVPTTTDLVKWNHADTWKYYDEEDKLHALMVTKEYEVTLTSDEFKECLGHQLKGQVVLPTSFYLSMMAQIFNNAYVDLKKNDMVFDNIHIRKHLIIPRNGFVPLHLMVQKGTGLFEIISDKDLLVTGKIFFPQPDDKYLLERERVAVNEQNVEISSGDFYSEMQHRGYKFAGSYKNVKGVVLGDDGSLASIQWNNSWPALLESMFQQSLLMTGEKSQQVFVPKFIQRVVISSTQLPTENTDVQVDFHYSTNMISTEGLQMLGFSTVPLEIDDPPLYLNTVEMVALNDAEFGTMEGGLEFAMQLALDNFHTFDVNTIFISELETDNPLTDHLRNVINERAEIDFNLNNVKESKEIVTQQSYPQLIVVNDIAKPDVVKLLLSTNALLLSKADKSTLEEPEIVQVAQFRMRNINYSLVRRVINIPTATVTVRGDVFGIKDLKRSSTSSSWVNELHGAIADAKLNNTNVRLVSTMIVPTEGINNFVQEVRAQPDMQNLQFVFDLDKRKVDLGALSRTGQRLAVFKDGGLYTVVSLSFRYKDNINLDVAPSNVIDGNSIKYLSVNLRDETINPEIVKRNELGNVDYSAVTSKGEKIMGLASLDKDSTKLVLDPVFKWKLPERWDLVEAATVPHAYLSAYYMLMIKGELKPGQTVLIHAGCSPIGLAAASVAASYGCHVYLTVSTPWQKAYLIRHYSFIDECNVLSSDNDSFESELKQATNGKGANVILNCVSGSLLRHSLACLADYGNFIQYGKYDVEEGNSIGMYCFLRNTSFYVVNLEDVLDEAPEIKEELRKEVDKGLEKLSVRPLVSEIVEHFDVPATLRQLKQSTNIGKIVMKLNNTLNVSRLNTEKPNKFICSPKGVYLIYGGTSESWCDVAEWLIQRGAKKVVVSSDSKPNQNHINRRLSLLQTYYEANIITAVAKANTKEGATDLLTEIGTLGPVQAVFVLAPAKNKKPSGDIKHVQYLEGALRAAAPKAFLLNLMRSAAGLCLARAEAGFVGTYNVQGAKEDEIEDCVAAFDQILSSRSNDVAVRRENFGETKQDKSKGLFKDVRKLLPTIDEIIKEQKRIPEQPDLIQVITEGPTEIRELCPLFFIPGLAGRNEMEELFTTLLYPTFCAVIPSKLLPIQKMAEILTEKILKVFSRGVYNIVSLSSGGPLAIEIARLLHRKNMSIHLFFVDSAPATIQQGFKQLGDDPESLQINILRNIFDINNRDMLEKLRSCPDWESRVKVTIPLYDGSEYRKKFLLNGLLGMFDRVQQIVSYKPTEELISGKVHLIRSNDRNKFDACELTNYCQKPPQTTLVSGDHLSIISNRETSDYINRFHSLK